MVLRWLDNPNPPDVTVSVFDVPVMAALTVSVAVMVWAPEVDISVAPEASPAPPADNTDVPRKP